MSSSASFLRSLNILHKSMLAGQVLLAGVAFLLRYFEWMPASLQELDQTLQVTALALCAVAYFLGARLFRQRVEQARDSDGTPREKAELYRSASILQWGMLEGASLFSVICFMLVGNLSFLFLSMALMIFFYISGPSKLKLMLLLRLSEEEIAGL